MTVSYCGVPQTCVHSLVVADAFQPRNAHIGDSGGRAAQKHLERALSYPGNPAKLNAWPSSEASAGAQSTPLNCRSRRKVGCNSSTRAAAIRASSSRLRPTNGPIKMT
jgi:hypothetical protein